MEYELIRSRRKTIGAEIRDNRLIVRAPLWMPQQEIDAFLQKHKGWLDKHLTEARKHQKILASAQRVTAEELQVLMDAARMVIPKRVAYYAPRVGVTYGRVTIRSQKTRWGSCSHQGNLNFNCLLMLTPPEVLDSVVVHELCHRKEMNHSPQFYAEVLRVFPDYYKWDGWLRENGDLILGRVGEE